MAQQNKPHHHYALGMHMPPRVWWNVRVDFIATLFFSLFNVVMNQFYIAFAIQEGASNLQVGILSAAPAIGLIFSPIWASWIEKSSSPKPFTIWPNMIGRLLLLLPAIFPDPSVYVVTAVIFQLLMGIQAPAYAALVSRIYPTNIRGRLMGYVRVGSGMLMIPLAYLVGSWADILGPRGPLIAAAIAGFISVSIFNSIKVSKQGSAPKTSAVKEVAKVGRKQKIIEQFQLIKSNRLLAIFLIATTFSGFGNMISIPLYQIIQVDILGLTNVEIGYARVAYYVALLLTFWLGGIMIDRIDIKYILLIGISAYAIVPMLYSLWGTYPAVLLGNGIQGIGEAIWDIGIMAFIFKIAPGREAVVFGIHLMFFGIRGSIGPILGTSLTSTLNIDVILMIASTFAWIGTLLFLWGNRKEPQLAAQK
ncbi:MFS transporter [Paenibacillus sp. FSL W7-1287]|uniref:MFS transporter n=1 Tax=Paenibacillus sp. FSL W7-1287 TaxID=2954538 RepID=UPI0030FCE805